MRSSHNLFCLRLTHKRHLPSATQTRRQTWRAASWDRPAVGAGLCRRTSPSSGLPSEQCWNKPQLVWFCLVFYYVKVTVLKILKLCTGIVVLTLCQHFCGGPGGKVPCLKTDRLRNFSHWFRAITWTWTKCHDKYHILQILLQSNGIWTKMRTSIWQESDHLFFDKLNCWSITADRFRANTALHCVAAMIVTEQQVKRGCYDCHRIAS